HARRNAEARSRHQHHSRALPRRGPVRHRPPGGPGADDLRNHRHSSAPRPRRTTAGAGGSDRGALAAAAGRADHRRQRIPQAAPLVLAGAAGAGGDAPPIVEKLNAAINEILRSKDAQAGFARLGAEAKIGSPQDFAAFIAAEAPRWTAIANETGIKVD